LEEIKNDNIDIYKLCDEINNTIIVMTTDMNTVRYLDIDNLKSELKKRIVVVNDLFSFAFAYGINNIRIKNKIELIIDLVMLDLNKINASQNKIKVNEAITYEDGKLKTKSVTKKIKLKR
jgi:hypothetical protein